MKILGNCPFCNGSIEVRKIKVNNKPSKLFACTNAHWVKDEDIFVLSEDSTCSFRIFQNSLKKYNKFAIGENETRELLQKGELEVTLHSKKKMIFNNGKKEYKSFEYKKLIIINKEYGIEVLF